MEVLQEPHPTSNFRFPAAIWVMPSRLYSGLVITTGSLPRS